jgi:hypothetical protein
MPVRLLVFLAALFILPLPALAQEDSTKANPLQQLFNGLNRAAQDTSAQEAVQKSATEKAVGFVRMLRTMADSSDAARERVQGMDLSGYIRPDSAAALMQYWSDKALNEAQSGLAHLYAAPMRGLSAEPPRGRLGEVRVAATGLSPLGSGFVADVDDAGDLVLSGSYSRQLVLGDTYLTTSDGEMITEMQELPRDASTAQPAWLYEGAVTGALKSLDVATTTAGGAYVLAHAPTGPTTTLAGRTFEHATQLRSLTLLLRLDDQGRLTWAFPVASQSYSWTGVLDERPDGSVILAYDLDGGLSRQASVNLSSQPRTEAPNYGSVDDDYRNAQLLAVFNADGTRQWQQVVDGVTVRALQTTAEGTTYVVGHFRGASSFCGGIRTGEKQQAAFAARLDADGRCEWIQTSTGSTAPTNQEGDPQFVASGGNDLRAVTVGPEGGVYVTGTFLRETTFAGRALQGDAPRGTGLVARLDAGDGSARWVAVRDVTGDDISRGVDGEPVGGYAFGHQLAADASSIYLVESRMHREPMRSGDPLWQFVLLRLAPDGSVLWEEVTGVSSGVFDSANSQYGMQLVEVPDGPPYLLAPGEHLEMAGQRVDPPGDGVNYLFVGRLGAGDADPTRDLRERLRNRFRNGNQ